jgi:hypothetical protein
LSRDLCRIVAFLQDAFRYDTKYRQFEDWWEHDGLHFERATIDIHGLFSMVKSPRSIYESTPDEEYVRIGVATPCGEGYLRFSAWWDEEGEALEGYYDVTFAPDLATKFHREVVSGLEAIVKEEDAQSYFASIIVQ